MPLFIAVVLAHWAEHFVQIFQIHVLGFPRSEACGLVGIWFPHITHAEWFHFSYALFMLIGLVALRGRFVTREYRFNFYGYSYPARRWWDIALAIMVWHFIEHWLLLYQSLTGIYLFGAAKPMSFLQTAFPAMRAELHFVYNAIAYTATVVPFWYLTRGVMPRVNVVPAV